MRITFASHAPIGGPFTVGSHHLARAFAQKGHEVVHVVCPITPFHVLLWQRADVRYRLELAVQPTRALAPRLRQLAPLSLVPGSIGSLVRLGRDPVLAATIPPVRGRLERLGFGTTDLLFIDDPWLHGLLDLIGSERIVYRPTDVYEFLHRPRVRKLESRILARSHGLVATSQPVLDNALQLVEGPIPKLVLENGVDVEHMSISRPSPPEYVHLPEPRVVYAGALDRRFDWDSLERAASQLPRVQFVLIGLRRPRAPTLPSNVHLLGTRPYAQLPAYLQHSAAGLLPLSDHPANRGRSPMKLYEYLAAGLPVVARSTPELARRQVPHVHLYASAEGLTETLKRVLEMPRDRTHCRAAAEGHDWNDVAHRLLSFAEELPVDSPRGRTRAHRS